MFEIVKVILYLPIYQRLTVLELITLGVIGILFITIATK
jgi:uncharacterized membrane protein